MGSPFWPTFTAILSANCSGDLQHVTISLHVLQLVLFARPRIEPHSRLEGTGACDGGRISGQEGLRRGFGTVRGEPLAPAHPDVRTLDPAMQTPGHLRDKACYAPSKVWCVYCFMSGPSAVSLV